MLHENEAATDSLRYVYKYDHMHPSDVKEGKIELIADCDGLIKSGPQRSVEGSKQPWRDDDCVASWRYIRVKMGDKLAGTRIIPLVIEKEKMERAKEVGGTEPIFEILPYKKKKYGIVTTGSEVFKGRIKDTFSPVIREKLAEFPSEEIDQIYVDDEKEHILEAIQKQIAAGAELIICTGGMSVDPDDCTPWAIMSTGARVVSYGAPVLPGAMMLVSYYTNEADGRVIPILGLPGCVMYAKRTIFDLVLPRIMAGDEITAEDIAKLGKGGLCLNCNVCTFPNCGFGK